MHRIGENDSRTNEKSILDNDMLPVTFTPESRPIMSRFTYTFNQSMGLSSESLKPPWNCKDHKFRDFLASQPIPSGLGTMNGRHRTILLRYSCWGQVSRFALLHFNPVNLPHSSSSVDDRTNKIKENIIWDKERKDTNHITSSSTSFS